MDRATIKALRTAGYGGAAQPGCRLCGEPLHHAHCASGPDPAPGHHAACANAVPPTVRCYGGTEDACVRPPLHKGDHEIQTEPCDDCCPTCCTRTILETA